MDPLREARDAVFRRALCFSALLLAFAVLGGADGAIAAAQKGAQPGVQRDELTGRTIAGAPVYERTAISRRYTIDRIYRSMKGPKSQRDIRLGRQGTRELLWITAHSTEIVGEDASSPEFMCHSNLSFSELGPHRTELNSEARARLFTLSQGQMDVRFPEGFGIPVMSDEPLTLATQVLNLNEQPAPLRVRHRAHIEYVRQADVKTPMKSLIVLSAQGMVALDAESRHFGEVSASEEEHGPGCEVGHPAGTRVIADSAGAEFAAHWVVSPGRDENRTLVTNWMNVPYDSTVHFIAVHLHPFAESAELIDLTNDEVLFRSGTTGADGRIGLTRVESYSSTEGIPIFRDHEYELKSVYDNTSGEDQDSMAVMFLYVHDRGFRLPRDGTASKN